MSNKKVVAGILTAVAAGAVISLLLGTKEGKKTGKKLVKKGSDFVKKGSDITDDLKGKFNDFIDQIQSKVQSALK